MCTLAFMQGWVSWAGWPRIVVTDRGLHNRGAFSKALTDNGVYVRMAALEAPEQIGRGEVHGEIFKKTLKAPMMSSADESNAMTDNQLHAVPSQNLQASTRARVAASAGPVCIVHAASARPHLAAALAPTLALASAYRGRVSGLRWRLGSVSYTHLTLPTILLV